MKTSTIQRFMIDLFRPEETYDHAVELYTEKSLGRAIKGVFWFVAAILSAAGLCCVFH